MSKILRIGHSPDPDDAFMFYGLAKGFVKIDDFEIQHIMEDIQTLNLRALNSELEVTAISAHLYPYVAKDYYIMKTGASMGEGYGPVIISKKYKKLNELKGKKLAHPGDYTTATLLTRIYVDDVELIYYPFDKIMEAIEKDDVDAGVIIHEGQITYQEMGFNGLLDFGELWEQEYKLPLPLGLDVVRKDLSFDLAKKISDSLADSIKYGYRNIQGAVEYAQQFGRGLDFDLTERFVKMYVNKLTIDMGEAGEKALNILFEKAYSKGITPKVEKFELV